MKFNLKEYILTGNIGTSNYLKILPGIHKHNKLMLTVFSAISSGVLAILLVLSFFIDYLRPMNYIFMIFLAEMLVICLFSRFVIESRPVYPMMIYIFICSIMGFGIVIGTVFLPDTPSVLFIALILSVPLLFTDRPIRMLAFLLFSIVCFIVSACFCEKGVVLGQDIFYSLTFGVVGVLSISGLNGNRLERRLLIYEKENSENAHNKALSNDNKA